MKIEAIFTMTEMNTVDKMLIFFHIVSLVFNPLYSNDGLVWGGSLVV